MLWDIFCKVIDNHGDAGVCWRLSAQLAARGHDVRLWIDDSTALHWMAPNGHPRVQVLPWEAQSRQPPEPGEVVIEAFGCELELAFQAAIAAKARARGRQPAWVNLEYLTAEPFAERSHGLASPISSGPAAGLAKHFYYPGFTARAGGLLREPGLAQRQAAFDREAWLRALGIEPGPARLASLFCYEPGALASLLAQLAQGPAATHLLVTSGRSTEAVRAAMKRPYGGALSVTFLPLLSQHDYDHLLWSCDVNFVRGEDSLVRALWAGKPFAWNIYSQHDDAHRAKLSAFLDWLEAPASLREFHAVWNGIAPGPLPPLDGSWAECMLRARGRLLAQDDLVAQLLAFVAGRSAP